MKFKWPTQCGTTEDILVRSCDGTWEWKNEKEIELKQATTEIERAIKRLEELKKKYETTDSEN